MINLLIDALIALIRSVDRGAAAVENVRRRVAPQPAADAQPAGAGVVFPASATGAGGHLVKPTSDVLREAAKALDCLGRMAYSRPLPWVDAFTAELRDHAAQLAVHGL